MSVPIQSSAVQRKFTKGKEGTGGKWAKGLGIAGGIIGGVAGGIFGGGVGAAPGAAFGASLAGIAAGSTMGSLGGGLADRQDEPPEEISGAPKGQGVPVPEDSMSRKMLNSQQDALTTYGNGIAALSRQPQDIRQEYGPPLFMAYMRQYDKKHGA